MHVVCVCGWCVCVFSVGGAPSVFFVRGARCSVCGVFSLCVTYAVFSVCECFSLGWCFPLCVIYVFSVCVCVCCV